MKVKIILVVLTVVILTQCKSAQFVKQPPFKIGKATYNDWVGGQRGVSGTNVIVAYSSKEKVNFKKIFFQDKETKIQIREIKGKSYVFGYFNTSTRNKEDFVLDIDPKKEMRNKLPEVKKDSPFDLRENEAVISYEYEGVIKFVKIKSLQKTKTDFYP